MSKEQRIRIRGKQRESIDADLMAGLVVLLGRQLAREAAQRQQAAGLATQPDACVEGKK